MNFTRFS